MDEPNLVASPRRVKAISLRRRTAGGWYNAEESDIQGEGMKSSPIRAIFFDAGNTLLYPRLDERARDLTEAGFPARVEDFHAAERAAKQKLDVWLWPQIRQGECAADDRSLLLG